MDLKYEIRRNSDGVLATGTDEVTDLDLAQFMWSDGNYSCDCNRELFFYQAQGLVEPDDNLCGDDRYSVRLSDAGTGEILYDEFEAGRK